MSKKTSPRYAKKAPPKRWPVVLLCLLLVLAAAAGALYYYVFHFNTFSLDIRLKGEENVTLEYGESYSDGGAQVFLVGTKLLTDGREMSDLLVTENGVDTAVLGSYSVDYSAGFQNFFLELTASARRTVTVTDTQAPVITLVSDPEKFTVPGETYMEEGFTASDNYDGDLTAKVQRTESDGVVTYTVADTAGNVTTVERTIRYDDIITPVLTLKGGNVTITEGNKYTEPGYTAIDNCDGDITSLVTVEGSVDTGKTGTYTLTYTVTDSYGNSATAKRTVTVNPKPEPEFVPPTTVPDGPKTVYLTFDDGPSKHTRQLLDILDKYGVKATFFVVGTANTSIYSEIVNRGHAIGIHCYSHAWKEVYASDEAYLKDLETMRQLILEKTGVDTRLLRFPGGSSNTASRKHCSGIMTRMTQKVREMGFQYFDWNVDSNDAGGASTAEKVYQNVITGLSKRNTSVVLQHDTKGYSVEAVEKIIQWGLENGYTFAALDVNSPGAHHTVRN